MRVAGKRRAARELGNCGVGSRHLRCTRDVVKIALAVPFVLALVAAGCRSAKPGEEGIRIGDKTLEQFQPGNTSESWVISVIGPPSSRTDILDGNEPVSILRYALVEKPPGGLFSLFTGSAPPKTTATIYFVSRSGMITQFWADREEKPTLVGKKTTDEGEKGG